MISIKIAFLYDRQIYRFHNRVDKIKNYINSISSKDKKVSHLQTITDTKIKYDLYVILSDDIYEIEKYINMIKIKDKNKIIIITKNKQIDHVIKCINITRNMYYLYSSDEYLVKKIKNIYESSLAKYN